MESDPIEGVGQLISLLDLKEADAEVSKYLELFHHALTSKDLQDIKNALDDEIVKIDKEMGHFLAIYQKKHSHELSNIELARARISSTVDKSGDLSALLDGANSLGHSLTYKIKSLDNEIGNVDATLKFVKDIQLLRNNINQANYSIQHSDWEVAAECIHTINTNLTKELINGQYASVVIPSSDVPQLPSETIEEWITLLIKEFQTRFKEASDQRNIPEVTKYFQLFPLINQEKAGLNCYSDFIGQIITETSRNLIQSASGELQTTPGIYSSIAVQLFESISIMLSQHGPLIRKYYEPTFANATAYVATRLQDEIDSQIGLISDTLYDVKKIRKVLQEIDLYSFPILTKRQNEYADESNNDAAEDTTSIVGVGDLINEIAAILHHWLLYSKFLTLRYFKDEDSEELRPPSIIIESTFVKKVQSKYLPAFESMYSFYFRRSIEKSITIEELPSLSSYLLFSQTPSSPDLAPSSSVIEDVTLVLNNTLRNVVDTSITSSVKKFVTYAFRVINNDFVNGFLVKNLKNNQPRYNQSLSLVSTISNDTANEVASPSGSRVATPGPETSSGMLFFKGASSAFGNVVSGSTAAGSSVSPSVNNVKLINFVLYMNTVAMSQEYFTKVIENYTKNNHNVLKSIYPFGKDNEIVATILSKDFLEPYTSMTNSLLNDNLINFYNQSLKNKILALISDFLPDSNESNYLVYSSALLHDMTSWQKFHTTWRAIVNPYKQTLHKTIFATLMRLLAINIANLLEKKLRFVLKKFSINELGSIKLEKDMSYLINEVCEDNYELREKFLRVTQIVLLIGMDDDEYDMSQQFELNEDKGEDEYSGISWVLTPEDRKQMRSYRI